MSLLGGLRRLLGVSTRSIEAGGNGPRWTAGKAIRSPAREITLRRQLAAERATWLAHNDATAAAIVSAWTGNIVADGPAIAAKTTDDALRAALAMRFDAWWSRCDAEEIDDLAGMLHRLVRGIVTTGEAFVILETDEDGEFRLRSVDPAQCDATLTRNLPNGRRIVAGIEMDERGRRIAYWFRDAEDMLTAYTTTPRRVDARDVLHLFDRQYPGQQRGLSWLAPVATTLSQLTDLQDSMLEVAKTASLFSGIITNASGQPAEGFSSIPGMEPGSLFELPPGMDVKFSSPPPLNGADAYRREMLHTISAGAGVPYELISSNLSEVNFSSARVGLHEFRRRVDTLRRTLLTARLLDPVWHRWLAHEALHGRVSPAIAAGLEMTAAWPGWPAIDPLKDAQSDQIAIAIGVESRQAVIARRGRDPREVDAEIAADTFRPQSAPAAQTEDKSE